LKAVQLPIWSRPRRFVLMRAEDETGISGTGRIADGVEFQDGVAVIRWNTETASTAIYGSIEDIVTIHGHGGKTTVHWID
jgi:hypothetical protein